MTLTPTSARKCGFKTPACVWLTLTWRHARACRLLQLVKQRHYLQTSPFPPNKTSQSTCERWQFSSAADSLRQVHWPSFIVRRMLGKRLTVSRPHPRHAIVSSASHFKIKVKAVPAKTSFEIWRDRWQPWLTWTERRLAASYETASLLLRAHCMQFYHLSETQTTTNPPFGENGSMSARWPPKYDR